MKLILPPLERKLIYREDYLNFHKEKYNHINPITFF